MTNYTHGGLPAVEQMVTDLAVVTEGAGALDDGAQEILHDAIMGDAAVDTREAADMASKVTVDHVRAMSRHSFALFLLEWLRKIESSEGQ